MLYWMPSLLFMVRGQKSFFFVNMATAIMDVTLEISSMTFSKTTKFFCLQGMHLCTYSYYGKN